MKKIKERIMSFVLAFAMVASLVTGMIPTRVHAEEWTPTEEELAEVKSDVISTLDITLEKMGDYWQCSPLPEVKDEHYKWVYVYFRPVVTDSRYEGEVESKRDMYQTYAVGKNVGATILPVSEGGGLLTPVEITDLENCTIPVNDQLGIFLIAQIYDWDAEEEPTTETSAYLFNYLTLFDLEGIVEGSHEENIYYNLLKPVENGGGNEGDGGNGDELTEYTVTLKYGDNPPANLYLSSINAEGTAILERISEDGGTVVVPAGGRIQLEASSYYSVTVGDTGAEIGEIRNSYGVYYCSISTIKENTTITVNKASDPSAVAPTPEQCPQIIDNGQTMIFYNNTTRAFYWKLMDETKTTVIQNWYRPLEANGGYTGFPKSALSSGTYYVYFCFADYYDGSSEPDESLVCERSFYIAPPEPPTVEDVIIDTTHPGSICFEKITNRGIYYRIMDKEDNIITDWKSELCYLTETSFGPLEAGEYTVSLCFKEDYNDGYMSDEALYNVDVTVTGAELKEGCLDTEKNEYIIDYKDGENVIVAIAKNHLVDGEDVAKYYTFDEIDWYKLPDDEEVRIVVINSDSSVSPKSFICYSETGYDGEYIYTFDFNVTFRDVSIEDIEEDDYAVQFGGGSIELTIDGDVYVEDIYHGARLEILGEGNDDIYTGGHVNLRRGYDGLMVRDLKKFAIADRGEDTGSVIATYGPITFLNIGEIDFPYSETDVFAGGALLFKNVKKFSFVSEYYGMRSGDGNITFENSFGTIVSKNEYGYNLFDGSSIIYVILNKETEVKSGADAETATVIVLNEDNSVNNDDIGQYFEIVGEPEHEHSLTEVPAVAATCTTDGNNKYYKCDCGEFFKDAEGTIATTVEAETILAGHSWVEDAWEMDTENHYHKCNNCTTTKDSEAHTDADGDYKCDTCEYVLHTHSLTEVPATSATCTADGNNKYYKCDCGKFFKEDKTTETTEDAEKIPSPGHSWVNDAWEMDTENHYHKCNNCTETKDSEAHADADGDNKCDTCGNVLHTHSLTEVPAVSATCTTNGNNKYYMCDCGKVFKDAEGTTATTVEAETIMAGHSWVEDSWEVGQTNHWHGCNNCTEVKDSEAHADEDGDDKCDDCGYVLHTHILTEVPAVSATCTQDGNEKYYVCSECDILFADANGITETTADAVKIEALGHDMTEATCTEAATCKRTGCEHTEEALGHDMTEATCTEAATCKRTGCDHTEEALGHDMTEATCTEDGKCKRTGCDYTEKALGHDITEATCTEEATCKRTGCDYTEKALGHDMTNATCTEAGKCNRSDCDYTEKALGHDMTEATCTEDGKCNRTGCDYTVEAHGHDWSGDWTVIYDATKINEGKKATFCTNDCGQKKVVTIPKIGEVDKKENLEKDVEVEPGAPIDEVTLDNTKEDLLDAENIFTDEEKQAIEDGEDARVWLEVSRIDENKITPEDRAEVEAAAKELSGENAKVIYFDAALFKKVGNRDKTGIEKPGTSVKITVVVPEEFLNYNKEMKREYKIIRLHKGVVDIISGVFNADTREFTFETDRFSTYAITYGDTPINSDIDVPNTGDNNASAYAMILMLVSGLGIYFCARKRNVMKTEN